jgi:capsular polysaccharide biosynthesis protein
MSWADFEDYEAEVYQILPDLSRSPCVTTTIVDGYKTKMTPDQVARKIFTTSPCDFNSVVQIAKIDFESEIVAKRFYEVMQEVSQSAKYRAIWHILDEQNGVKHDG